MNLENVLGDHLYHDTSTGNCEEYITTNQPDLKLLDTMTRDKSVSEIHDHLMEGDHFETDLMKNTSDTQENKEYEGSEYTLKLKNSSEASLKFGKNIKLEDDLWNSLSEDRPVDEDYGLLIHDDIVLFSCRHCHLAYDSYVSLKDHAVVEHGVVLQRKDCQHCLNILETHTRLLQHLKENHLNILSPEQAEKLKKKFPIENASKRFFCDKCKKGFSSKASLLNHLKKFHMKSDLPATIAKKQTKAAGDDHQCTSCSISFASSKALQLHQETTHDTKVFLCLDCDSSFQTRSSLNLHNIYHHRVHRCSSCLILFQGRLSLTNHVKQHHPGMPVYRADSRFVCEYCSQSFSIRSQLSDHIQSGHLGKINQCEDCGKVLSTAETLKVHRLKHRPEKHRTCEHCGRQFYRTGMLTEHIRACHSEMLSDDWRQRTTCPYCQARFTRRESMRRHIEAKHEPKRFLCSFCERPFTCRRYLVRHENKHHLGRPSS